MTSPDGQHKAYERRHIDAYLANMWDENLTQMVTLKGNPEASLRCALVCVAVLILQREHTPPHEFYPDEEG